MQLAQDADMKYIAAKQKTVPKPLFAVTLADNPSS
jgi:hypothetical protein